MLDLKIEECVLSDQGEDKEDFSLLLMYLICLIAKMESFRTILLL